ncbi:hypothetical protein [Sphingomonas bacterium]|uniref:hypothetical protein n=1 Tax=Sphingomonas bacterium TaxID=1895847 RepID=UPI001575359F|nr:hypothetical protein [Sphingomonas bacterium]
MSDTATLSKIADDLADLQRRVDFLADPRLDGVVGRLLAARGELRRVMASHAAVLRFDR